MDTGETEQMIVIIQSNRSMLRERVSSKTVIEITEIGAETIVESVAVEVNIEVSIVVKIAESIAESTEENTVVIIVENTVVSIRIDIITIIGARISTKGKDPTMRPRMINLIEWTIDPIKGNIRTSHTKRRRVVNSIKLEKEVIKNTDTKTIEVMGDVVVTTDNMMRAIMAHKLIDHQLEIGKGARDNTIERVRMKMLKKRVVHNNHTIAALAMQAASNSAAESSSQELEAKDQIITEARDPKTNNTTITMMASTRIILGGTTMEVGEAEEAVEAVEATNTIKNRINRITSIEADSNRSSKLLGNQINRIKFLQRLRKKSQRRSRRQ